jgi:extracellular elastinolytic metalloproteinase
MVLVRKGVPLAIAAVALSAAVAAADPSQKAKHLETKTVGSPSSATVVTDVGAAVDIALQYLRDHAEQLGLTAADLADVGVTSAVSSHTGTTHVYLRQRHAGIDVHGAAININVTADGRVLGGFGNSFVGNVAAAIASHAPSIGAVEAATKALQQVGLEVQGALAVSGGEGGTAQDTVLTDARGADYPVKAKLIYERLESGDVIASWLIEIPEHDQSHWWVISIDGRNGDVLEQVDQTIHDAWVRAEDVEGAVEEEDDPPGTISPSDDAQRAKVPIEGVPGSGYFNVFAWPHGDPNDGPREWVVNPADPLGSPFGWNDTNGVPGPELTSSFGNNVDAYLDLPDDDVGAPAERVEGGPNLVFDFPLDLTAPHQTVRNAAIANLFYWNNIIHDIAYRYGFDEASGNFQTNSYGRFTPPVGEVPADNDYVRAEAQDGSGMNNANFSTGADGQRPRMQMFLWVPQGGYQVQITSGPVGDHNAVRANFGAFLGDIFVTQPTAQVVLASPANGCAALVGFPAGSIAYVDAGGGCSSVTKTQNAQNAGAVGIIINTNSASPQTLTGISLTANIPVLGVSSAVNAAIRPGLPFTAKMAFLGTPAPLRDGDFDAQVITHEYGHGISNRLTGGRTVTGCLGGNEQMGEGWSDFLALSFTHDADRPVQRTRGLGPYIRFTGVDGPGIRTTRYSTDMTINPTTYATIATGTLSVPHGIGYAWATALWDVYWNLIDKHGFNENVYDPWWTGGNNLAIQLVMDGMKLQPCRPGFVTGRDAILQADALLTGGENTCAMWRGFAKRGLGFGADQGSVNSVNDGVESFAMPPACLGAFLIEPKTLQARIKAGKSASSPVLIFNSALVDGDNLTWTAHEAVSDCSVPSDVPWLSISGGSATVAPQQRTKPTATINTAGLAPGNYSALVCFSGNGTTAQMPVQINVTP